VRAVDLARELGVDPKRLRQWLRESFPHERNAPWDLTPEHERQARVRFGRGSLNASTSKEASPLAARGTTGRHESDEAYVIDLCDELLGERAHRQHRFPWLLGDAASGGARVQLPVDAYYPNQRLVVEYRERQHYEPTPFFDRRQTVSGVGRGEQRRMYDDRREREVPQHGLRLIIVRSSDLRSDRGACSANDEATRKRFGHSLIADEQVNRCRVYQGLDGTANVRMTLRPAG